MKPLAPHQPGRSGRPHPPQGFTGILVQLWPLPLGWPPPPRRRSTPSAPRPQRSRRTSSRLGGHGAPLPSVSRRTGVQSQIQTNTWNPQGRTQQLLISNCLFKKNADVMKKFGTTSPHHTYRNNCSLGDGCGGRMSQFLHLTETHGPPQELAKTKTESKSALRVYG